MSFLSLFKKKGDSNTMSILSEPGDKFEARITKSNRQVAKIQKKGGSMKYSATKYPNGTIVETRVRKNK